MALKDFTGTPAEKAEMEAKEKKSFDKERSSFALGSKDTKPEGYTPSRVLSEPKNTGVRISPAMRKDKASMLTYLKSRKLSMANKSASSSEMAKARLEQLKKMAGNK